MTGVQTCALPISVLTCETPDLERIEKSLKRGTYLAHVPDTRLAGEVSGILRRTREFSETADILGEVMYRLANGKHIEAEPESGDPF